MENLDYKTLLDISRAVNTVRDAPNLLRLIMNEVHPLFGFYDVGIFVLDKQGKRHRDLSVAFPDTAPSEAINRLNAAGLSGWLPHEGSLIEHHINLCECAGEPLVFTFDQMLAEFPDYPFLEIIKPLEIQDFLATLLRVRGEIIGILYFNSLEKNFFKPSQFALFQSVADQVAVAVSNILAKEEIVEREREKSILLEISEAVTNIRDRDELFHFIADEVQPLFGFNQYTNICVYDREQATLQMFFTKMTAINQQESEIPTFMQPFPVEGIFKTIVETNEIVITEESWKNDSKTSFMDQASAQIWRDLDFKYALSVALRSFGKVIGTLHVHFFEARQFTASQLRLFKSIADQIASAVANILANEEIAALAEERRLRAEQLAKSNEALARTSARLVEQPDLTAFLGQVVIEACEQLHASAGHLIVYDAKRELLHTAALVENGKVVAIDPLAEEMPAAEAKFFPLLFEMREPRYFDVEREEHLLWRGAAQYLRERNKKHVIAFPLAAGQAVLGVMGLAFGDKSSIAEEQSELVGALAHQAALAIQLTRLADEAKQAAVAKEQEKAAQERAEELARANEALQRSTLQLSSLENVELFVAGVLLEVIKETSAKAAVIFQVTTGGEFLQMTHYAEGSEMLDIRTDSRLAVWRDAKKAVGNAASERMLTGEILWVDYSQEAFPGDWEEAFPFHQMMGHKTVAGVPFIVGGNFMGFLSICFADEVRATEAKIRLCQTLAQHAALALHFTALANEAEQAATLEERNRIAREIHDTLAQGFTGVIVQLNTAKRILSDGGGGNNIASAKIVPFIDRVIDLARESLAEARRSVGALRPAGDGDSMQIDLPRLLREKLEYLTAGTNTKNKFSVIGTPHTLAPETAVNLLRIGQEAVTNALRHAQARKIEIEIIYDAGEVCLYVSDDGRGFETAQRSGGYGLKGIRERAAQIGAKLEIESRLGNGTKVKAFFKI